MAFLDRHGSRGMGLDAMQSHECPHCHGVIETFRRLGGKPSYSVRIHVARCRVATPEEREVWKRTGRWAAKSRSARRQPEGRPDGV